MHVEFRLTTVNGFTQGRVITVVGCGGNRDRMKRSIMGTIAYENSDLLFLTSDNPRDEFPDHIIIEMVKEISSIMLTENSIEKRDRKKVIIRPDRRVAISEAIRKGKPGDSIVIAGKGHENYQEIYNKTRLSFDDCLEAENIIKMLKYENY